jgi:hypothetical protein
MYSIKRNENLVILPIHCCVAKSCVPEVNTTWYFEGHLVQQGASCNVSTVTDSIDCSG